MEPISGIEKLIGFIYRILFTIIPSGAFLCISVVFLKLNPDYLHLDPDAIHSLRQIFVDTNSFWQALLPLCLIFSLSLFMEAIDLFLFYYVMDFGNLTNLRLFADEKGAIPYEPKNKEFNELYKTGFDINTKTGFDTNTKRFVQKHHYTLGLIKSLMHHPRVFSHIYYQLGREFVFNNLTVALLLVGNLYGPFVIANHFSKNFGYFWILQSVQPVLTVLFLWSSYRLLKKYNAYKNKDAKPDFDFDKFRKEIRTFPYVFFEGIVLLLFFSAILFPTAIYFQNTLLLFLAFNCLLFPIVLVMVFKGFKEYLNVEKYYFAYFIERHFLKLDEPDGEPPS